jgi:hypothetical protein
LADTGSVRIVLAGAFVVALLATSSATASSPSPSAARYRASLNAICRVYTPYFKRLEKQMVNDETAKNYSAYSVELGEMIGLLLRQNNHLEAVPVPAPLTAPMRPIIALLRQIDTHLRRSVADATRGNTKAAIAEFNAFIRISPPLNKMFDSASLRDCGSNQP